MADNTRDARRRIVGLVTLQNRNYRYNPSSNYWEPANWPKDDPTISMGPTIATLAAGGTFQIGTYISGSLDTLIGDANYFIGSLPATGRVILQAKVNGTIKRQWGEFQGAGIGTVSRIGINSGASPFDSPLFRVPAAGTLVVEVVTDTLGTLNAGFSAFGARY